MPGRGPMLTQHQAHLASCLVRLRLAPGTSKRPAYAGSNNSAVAHQVTAPSGHLCQLSRWG
jgi:hypothetical protein